MANCTILLIDYEPRSIERFRDPLTAAGYSVEIATDGVSGIEAFHRLNPDMVLVEAMIPKKHGFEVCQELKRTPHGRRTPVIITTGVYKGRKYRTQALHIYGCDEYIEKPIAAEQLLEIVGKFFVSGSSGPSARSVEPERDTSSSGDARSGPVEVDAIAKPAPTAVKDDTEDEIMARLDALLTGPGPAAQSAAAPERVLVAPAADHDPFAEMRAEINAELSATPEPLPFETEPKLEPMPESFQSDQVPAPSLLETLEIPEVVVPVVPSTTATPGVATEETSGQIVNFDTKRSRKGKKADRQGAQRTSRSTQAASAPEPIAPAMHAVDPTPHVLAPTAQAAEPRVVDSPVALAEVRLPRGTIVESELAAVEGLRRKPVWAWIAVGLVAMGALFLVFGRGGSNPPGTASTPAPEPEPVASAPADAIEPQAVSAPAETLPKPPDPSPVVANDSKPVHEAVKPPAPKKSINRTPSTTPPSTAAGSRKASDSSVTPPVTPPVARTTGPERTAPEAPAAPRVPDASAAGVEAVPDPSTESPIAAIEPGVLIPIDVADTMPVALTHRAPEFSAETRQLHLSGTVIMNVLVNDHGAVDQVVLVTGVSGGDVNEAAMRAAKSWTYRPATKSGVPVRVWKSEQLVIKP